MKIGDQKFQVLIEKRDIEKRIHKLAKKIQHDFHGEELIIVCVLKGAFIFCADLVRQFENFNCNINFIQLSSYDTGTESKGYVQIDKDLEINIRYRNVLIVEDIVDTGYSLTFLTKKLLQQEPKKLKTCVLLDKKSRRKVEFNPDYVGFEIEDKFVIGYGLDYKYNYRELDQIYYLDESNE